MIDKKKIAEAFGKAAANYDNFSVIQRIAGNILLSKIETFFNISILDAGCGTGWFSKKWRQLGNTVTALDFSKNMLLTAKNTNSADYYLHADMEQLPICDNIFDLSWSNLSLQWCNKFNKAISELCRVTKPGGMVVFSTIAHGSLYEFNKAYRTINSSYQENKFLSINDIKLSCCNKKTLIDNILITFSFSKILEAMYSFKKIGANYISSNHSKILTKKKIRQLQENWPYNPNGYLLSYRFVFGVIYL
ncbi:biotin synthesis protein BioC [Buchnera aphidicola str. Bp (Baizongia pistaciae)]|uniref:Malonyl-[acyl-carrier protein] O-methyltransferase n=1 Tax=Buchnera aphidicola subsp. Baizongia pistaciae (strain Bp) TaxID=224915 RepID=BIOC_BUCBP|nr:malonyl-ACP O-methyltransferase BioC [Buchnera aphidicola]Q89AK7.1 RecName: Full=Malonyl-[acyl-carrier protein] O-methyltransferase; Short=Malonyl-ACP O-methyltransferase; AltName: Full=Biotin synthesis protein BioC [Buchnera aphidicola str. Bp (Baizongia pistaciae)]AAO26995.1 biotin synthesis protein BioC [Buchnera aphidicola str. Bp (Baizongia pistaciae)]